MPRSEVQGLEYKVEWSNYDYSNLKKRERKESYSIVRGALASRR